jgi:uncharacterized integral membrane protein
MNWKVVFFLVLAILVGIFIAENLEDVEFTFMGWAVELPRYQVALGLVGAGFIMGLLARSMLTRKRRAKKRSLPTEQESAEEFDT